MNNNITFYISGKKDIIFRKEGDFFISFDPIALEFIEINMIGAEILYLISEKVCFNEIVKYFIEKYDIDENEIKIDIMDFINKYRCRNLIEDILTDLNFNINGV